MLSCWWCMCLDDGELLYQCLYRAVFSVSVDCSSLHKDELSSLLTAVVFGKVCFTESKQTSGIIDVGLAWKYSSPSTAASESQPNYPMHAADFISPQLTSGLVWLPETIGYSDHCASGTSIHPLRKNYMRKLKIMRVKHHITHVKCYFTHVKQTSHVWNIFHMLEVFLRM